VHVDLFEFSEVGRWFVVLMSIVLERKESALFDLVQVA
jgi:hypothetical protein